MQYNVITYLNLSTLGTTNGYLGGYGTRPTGFVFHFIWCCQLGLYYPTLKPYLNDSY